MKRPYGLFGLFLASSLSFSGPAWSAGTVDHAAPYPPPAAGTPAPAYDSGPVEARLAYLKNELKITSDQSGAWDRYADVYRSTAKSLSPMRNSMMGTMQANLPSRIAVQQKMMEAQLDAMKSISGPLLELYALLNADQKRAADELMGPGR